MAELIKHPQASFLLRIRGESMRDVGIFDGDVVLVDRAITPRSGQVVVAVVENETGYRTSWVENETGTPHTWLHHRLERVGCDQGMTSTCT